MNKTSATAIATTAFYLYLLAMPAYAELVSAARIPASGGHIIFELYDEPPLIPECRGKNANGAIAKLEKGSTKMGYGSGCWTADINGYIHLLIKSLDDGVVRESKIHNSKFLPQQKPASEQLTKDKCRETIKTHAFLSRGQFECKFEKYNQDMLAEAQACSEIILERERKNLLERGFQIFDENAKERGKSRMCSDMLRDFPNIYSN